MTGRRRRNRDRRGLNFLNEDGMVACNPRDREAAHRAEMEGIATEDAAAVTCRKCREIVFRERLGISPRGSLTLPTGQTVQR